MDMPDTESKLSDASRKLSTKENLLRILDKYENSVRSAVQAMMSSTNQNAAISNFDEATLMKAVSSVIEKDEELQATLKVGEEQLAREQTIASVKDEIAAKDLELIQIQSQLRDAEQILSNALYHAKKKVEALRKASKAPVSSEELIKFAFRISSGCSVEAPPDWTPGDPRRPYPLDMELRAGHLGRQLVTEDDATRLGQISRAPERRTSTALSSGDTPDGDHQMTDKHDPLNPSDNTSLWHLTKMASDDIDKNRPMAALSSRARPTPPAVATSALNNALLTPLPGDEVEFMPSSSDSTSSDSS